VPKSNCNVQYLVEPQKNYKLVPLEHTSFSFSFSFSSSSSRPYLIYAFSFIERMKYFHGKLFTLTLPPQSSTSISDFIMNFC